MKKSGNNTIKNWAQVILMSAATYVAIYLVLSVLAKYFPNVMSGYTSLMDNYGLENGWRNWLYVILVAPAGEEVIFRGFIFKVCRSKMSFLWANLIQAALFGMVHATLTTTFSGWIQVIYTFVLGLILGYVLENYKKLEYPIVFHVLFNFWNIPMQWAAGVILASLGCALAL
ncbi:MAG: CPBP family intramembrane metalloprotease [Eubacterium sp.]|nr:CPBP family intramembrane metalloprotease [Eubacterium sp.]